MIRSLSWRAATTRFILDAHAVASQQYVNRDTPGWALELETHALEASTTTFNVAGLIDAKANLCRAPLTTREPRKPPNRVPPVTCASGLLDHDDEADESGDRSVGELPTRDAAGEPARQTADHPTAPIQNRPTIESFGSRASSAPPAAHDVTRLSRGVEVHQLFGTHLLE